MIKNGWNIGVIDGDLLRLRESNSHYNGVSNVIDTLIKMTSSYTKPKDASILK